MSTAAPDDRPAPVPSRHPPHRLRIFELDPAQALVPGVNPVQLADLAVPHEVTQPRREAAARALVAQHAHRTAREVNHVAGDRGDMTAIVLAHPAPPKG